METSTISKLTAFSWTTILSKHNEQHLGQNKVTQTFKESRQRRTSIAVTESEWKDTQVAVTIATETKSFAVVTTSMAVVPSAQLQRQW